MFGHKIKRNFKGENINQLIRSIALDYSEDFARDNGMTPEEYVDTLLGDAVGTEKGDLVRIMPCVKFEKKPEDLGDILWGDREELKKELRRNK